MPTSNSGKGSGGFTSNSGKPVRNKISSTTKAAPEAEKDPEQVDAANAEAEKVKKVGDG
jgi:hypothetical protein